MEFELTAGRDVLGRTPAVLDGLLRGIPEAWATGDEGRGTWSSYEVLGHLVHLEEVDWLERARVILSDDSREFRPIDREGGFERFAGWSIDALLDRFADRRASNLAELSGLVTDRVLDRQGRHPDFGTVSLRQLLATWVVHDLNHLGQIVKTMAKQYGGAVGPWQAYLPIIDAE